MLIKNLIKEVSGLLMAVSFMSCYLPQILKIWKTKSSSDISPLMIYFGLLGYIFGLIYMFTNVWGLWWFANYFSGIITSIALLYFYYRHK
jgi:uncharacterized protein with PQ loop repeat